MKEILEALKNSSNESGKHIHSLYKKYCKLLYEVDYGYKIYESKELFTDFLRYILDIKEYKIIDDYVNIISNNPQIGEFNLKFNDRIITSIRTVLVFKNYEQDKQSNLNQLKNAKLP